MFRITIEEIVTTPSSEGENDALVKRYEQTVEEINLKAIIAAVNAQKRGPRAAKVKPQ